LTPATGYRIPNPTNISKSLVTILLVKILKWFVNYFFPLLCCWICVMENMFPEIQSEHPGSAALQFAKPYSRWGASTKAGEG
jgi:hypothetical protein